MSVAPGITRLILEEELVDVLALARAFGWRVTSDLESLTVTVVFESSIDGEEYILEALCDNYREQPPLFEFIDPKSGERGSRRSYPSDSGASNYFHNHPCICIQWNRKAYQQGAPHGSDSSWRLSSWTEARPGTRALGDMFTLVHRQINDPTQYKGRMES